MDTTPSPIKKGLLLVEYIMKANEILEVSIQIQFFRKWGKVIINVTAKHTLFSFPDANRIFTTRLYSSRSRNMVINYMFIISMMYSIVYVAFSQSLYFSHL